MLNKKYNKYFFQLVNNIISTNDFNKQIFINEPNINNIILKLLSSNLKKKIDNTNVIIIDSDLSNLLHLLKYYNKSYTIIYNYNNILKLRSTPHKFDFYIIKNKKIKIVDKKLIDSLKIFQIKINKSMKYNLYHIFLFYFKSYFFHNIYISNINDLKINTEYQYQIDNKSLYLNINLPSNYSYLYYLNDTKSLDYYFQPNNLIKTSLNLLLSFKLNKNIHIKNYIFNDILKINKSILNIIKNEQIIELVNDYDIKNIKINQFLNVIKFNNFSFIFNKMIPFFYNHDISNLKYILDYIQNNQNFNDSFIHLFLDTFNIEFIFFKNYKLLLNDNNFRHIVINSIINELYYIENITSRFYYNINTKHCSICYNDITDNVIVLSCCQQIMCEICSIRATFKNNLQKYDAILGICPFCKSILELENDLLLTNINIDKNIKNTKLIHTNKKSIIHIIKHIITNKYPKFINKIYDFNNSFENINNSYVFTKFLNKKNKTFVITLNDNKEFKYIIEKIDTYNMDYFILNANLNLIDLLHLQDFNKLFLTNLTFNSYNYFIEKIINTGNKSVITNLIIINPKNNMFLKNIIFKLKTYVNIFVLNTV